MRFRKFVLWHTGMMIVFFTLAVKRKNLIVNILGNVLVIALDSILAGIQALHLEYYEMFSRFYEGGGRPFVPVTLKKINNN